MRIRNGSWIRLDLRGGKTGRRKLLLAMAHIDGPGANKVGVGGLRALARQAMEELDVDEIVVEGATRSTGAHPGRRPSPLRFRRAPGP